MMTGAPTPPPPPHDHPIDPVSQALGRIEGRLEALATKADLAAAVKDLVTREEFRAELRATREELRVWVLGLGAWTTLLVALATWLRR